MAEVHSDTVFFAAQLRKQKKTRMQMKVILAGYRESEGAKMGALSPLMMGQSICVQVGYLTL